MSRFLENLRTCALGRVLPLSSLGCHVNVINSMTASHLFIQLITNSATLGINITSKHICF